MFGRGSRTGIAVAAVCALGIAACGGDDGSSSDTSPATAASTAPAATSSTGDTTTVPESGGGDSLHLDEPVKIALLWEIKGESAIAIDDYNDGAEFAIQDINAAGGIGGQQIESTRVPLSQTDTQKATGQFLQAVDSDPVAIIGFPSSGSLLSAETQIDRAGIPVLAPVSGANVLGQGNDGVSELTWIVNIRSAQAAYTSVDYFVDELGLSKIGVMGTNESYGTVSAESVQSQLGQKGLEPTAVALYPPDATDLTPQVQQMKGSDAVLHYGFPNTTALQLKQFVANGLDIPTGGGGSAVNAVVQGLADGDAISQLYAFTACSPGSTGSIPALDDFSKRYQEVHGRVPSVQAAQAYDAVYILKAAIELAGSADPQAINDAIGEVEYTGGLCASTYRADPAHFMAHELTVTKYAADGSATVVKTETLPEVPEF